MWLLCSDSWITMSVLLHTSVSLNQIFQMSLSIPVRTSALDICRFVLVFLQCTWETQVVTWNTWNLCWIPGQRWNSYTAESKHWYFNWFNGATHGSESQPHKRGLKILGIKILKFSVHKIKLRHIGPLGEGVRESVHSAQEKQLNSGTEVYTNKTETPCIRMMSKKSSFSVYRRITRQILQCCGYFVCLAVLDTLVFSWNWISVFPFSFCNSSAVISDVLAFQNVRHIQWWRYMRHTLGNLVPRK